MIARFHHQDDTSKLLEIDALPRLQRVLDEEWDDALEQMLLPPDPVSHPVAVVRTDHAATEKRLESMEDLHISLVLHDGEFRQYLKACGHFRVGIDPHVKTTFTIHEACYPLRVELHGPVPNVKSLRVPGATRPSLRIVPMSVGFLLPAEWPASTERLWRSFPHMVRFY